MKTFCYIDTYIVPPEKPNNSLILGLQKPNLYIISTNKYSKTDYFLVEIGVKIAPTFF